MEYINLEKQNIDELENKYVVVNGINYYIGEFISKAKTKIVYRLYNAKSKICSHVIKLYRDSYSIAERKWYNELLASELLYELGILDPDIIIPNKVERDTIYKGLFLHIEELITNNREYNNKMIDDAKMLLLQNKYTNALQLYETQLNLNPYQTEALLGKFLCRYLQKQFSEDEFYLLKEILEIEPHSRYYYHICMLLCLKNEKYAEFLTIFRLSKQNYIKVEPLFKNVKEIIEENCIQKISKYQQEINGLYQKELKHYYEKCVAISIEEIYTSYQSDMRNKGYGYVPTPNETVSMLRGTNIISFEQSKEYYAMFSYDHADLFSYNLNNKDFDNAIAIFNKNKDPKSYEMFYDLVKENPCEKWYIQAFLYSAFYFKKHSNFIDIYRRMNPNFSTETLDYMAVQSYLYIGLPEKALMLSTELNLPSELRALINSELQKKEKQKKLSEQAYKAIACERDLEKAFRLQREATEIYPFGLETALNTLIDCIDKKAVFDNQVDQIMSFTFSGYSYYILHLCFYKIKMGEFDSGFENIIIEYYRILKKHYFPFNDANSIPSKLKWFNIKGSLEEPLYIAYQILQEGYMAIKDSDFIYLEEYKEIVKIYFEASEMQTIP